MGASGLSLSTRPSQIELDLDGSGNLVIQGTLSELSDREAKQHVELMDGSEVLGRIQTLPISEWSYTGSPGHRHAGPMAQDFHAAFGLGKDERHISARDIAGVSLAAIQALESRNRTLESRISALESVQQENAELKSRLAALETLVMQPASQGK